MRAAFEPPDVDPRVFPGSQPVTGRHTLVREFGSVRRTDLEPGEPPEKSPEPAPRGRGLPEETGIDVVRNGKADPATHWILEAALPSRLKACDSSRILEFGANDDNLEPLDAAPIIAATRQIGFDGMPMTPDRLDSSRMEGTWTPC